MTTLQTKARDEAIAIIQQSLSGIREMERKAREIDRKLGALRSKGDSGDLQELHLEAGCVVNSDHGDRLRLAVEWLSVLDG